jgi:hypothetical protein
MGFADGIDQGRHDRRPSRRKLAQHQRDDAIGVPTLRRVSDRTIIESYITCPSCGKRQIEDTSALTRIIALADSAGRSSSCVTPTASTSTRTATMAPIQKRDAIVKKLIRTALGDEDLEDEEMLERVRALHPGVAPASRRAAANVRGAMSGAIEARCG